MPSTGSNSSDVLGRMRRSTLCAAGRAAVRREERLSAATDLRRLRDRADDTFEQVIRLPQTTVIEAECLVDHDIALVVLERTDEDWLARLEVRDRGGDGLAGSLGSAGSEGSALH